MSTPTRYQEWRQALLAGRVGQAEEPVPDPDPEDPTDYASQDEGAAVQVAFQESIVEPSDDLNLAATVTNAANNTADATGVANVNDGDGGTFATFSSGVTGAGTITRGFQTDLGSAALVDAMVVHWIFGGGTSNPTHVEFSDDASAWTATTGAWTTAGLLRTFTLDTPSSHRYWRVRTVETFGGLAFFTYINVYRWEISGTGITIGDKAWYPAPATNDGNTSTSAGSNISADSLLRVALAVERVIYRISLDVGEETAGATVYELHGSDDPAFASTTLLATLSFTATGSFTLDTVEASWVPTAAYTYFQLEHVSGGGDSREFYEIRLFSAVGVPGSGVTDHDDLTGRDAADQHPADSVTLEDTAGWFTATNVETALAELAAKAIGYQAHGNLGSTEAFDAATGWHSGTLNANCTLTLTAAPTGTVSSLFLELTQDGTGGRTITLPASVTNKADLEADQVTTLSTTAFLVLLSRDGGTTWYGGWWGQSGGGASALDDLTDVTITSPQEDDTLRYVGGEWVNDDRFRALVVDGFDTLVWEGDDLVWEWTT